MILSNTFNIVMAVFDVSQQIIQQSAGLIQGSTAVTPDVLNDMQTQLEAMELGPLLGIFLQSFFVQFTMTALNIVIFVIVYGRMIEIYLMTSLAPIPFATSVNREVGHMGHNYFKSLFAVGFQGMLIIPNTETEVHNEGNQFAGILPVVYGRCYGRSHGRSCGRTAGGSEVH